MTSNLRFVFDTNAIVSALFLKQSVSRSAFDHAIAVGKLLISEATIGEFDDVLRRPKFNKYIAEDDRVRFLAKLLREAILVEALETIAVCRDPKDNKFLELAVGGNASCIVTGDKDLLALNPFRLIPIMSPRAFLEFVAHDTK